MIAPPPKSRPRLKRPGFLMEIIQTIIFVVVVTVLFDMAIPRSLVDGRSMQPTFADRERLIVSRLHYLARLPQRGEVVVFNSLEDASNQDMLIKRVIGLPGETVSFVNGDVTIGGQRIDEPYIQEPCGFSCRDRTWELGANEYFVMGDNRNHSRDSRSFGAVPLDHVVGRVVFRYYPIMDIGIIPTPNYSLSVEGR